MIRTFVLVQVSRKRESIITSLRPDLITRVFAKIKNSTICFALNSRSSSDNKNRYYDIESQNIMAWLPFVSLKLAECKVEQRFGKMEYGLCRPSGRPDVCVCFHSSLRNAWIPRLKLSDGSIFYNFLSAHFRRQLVNIAASYFIS